MIALPSSLQSDFTNDVTTLHSTESYNIKLFKLES
jgi:hypothetical protein